MNKISLVLLAIALNASDIRISEVMSNPQGSEYENEFVEVYNHSDHVIQINGWVLSDGTGVDTIAPFSGPEQIPAHGYAIILDPSYPLNTGPYLIPDSIPLYTISTDATLGSGGLSNSGESVIIRSPDSASISQMSWSKPSDNGFSWERVSLDVSDSAAVWQQSLIENGTPGYRNSVELPQFDLRLASVDVNSSSARQSIDFEAIIVNAGAQTAIPDVLRLQILDKLELLREQKESLPDILPGDSVIWSSSVEIDRCGWLEFKIDLFLGEDENPDDNFTQGEIYLSCAKSPLIINEIMPLPLPDKPEWVELYNTSNKQIDLMDWQLSDDHLEGSSIVDSSFLLDPDSFVLLSKHSVIEGSPWNSPLLEVAGFPTLNNSGDAVLLIDPLGKLMDEMSYDENSGLAEGRSWERINTHNPGSEPRNWGVCIANSASTPGYINSLHFSQLSPELQIRLDPNPFTPNGDGDQDELIIHYELPFQQAMISVIIFDMAGRIIAQPFQSLPVAHRGQLSWDGNANYGGIAVTGLYICGLYVDNLQGQVIQELRKIYLVK